MRTEEVAAVFYFGHKCASTYNFHISRLVWAKFGVEYLCAMLLA